MTVNTKRKTIKKITGASALIALAPSIWTKPIVDAIVLPAHAQTSAGLPSLDPIASIGITCGSDRNRFPECRSDPRVTIDITRGSTSNQIRFELDISGKNINENARFSIVNDPTASNNTLGTIFFVRNNSGIPRMIWLFGFATNDPPNNDDQIPFGLFNLILRVENPNGDSAVTSFNVNFR